MRKILHAALLLAVMTSHIFAVEHDSDSLNDLTIELRAVIPEGWKVSINRFKDEDDDSIHIEVWRLKKVQFFRMNTLNGPPPSGPPRRPGEQSLKSPEPPNPPEFFYFNFYLTDYLSPKDYAQLAKENAVIQARLVEYTKAMSNVKRHGKARAFSDTGTLGYYPKIEDEKRRLQELVDYKKSHPKRHLPQDYHYQKMSFDFFDPRNIQRLKSKEIDTECTKVLKSIIKVFLSY
jgi:hypothetical protein